MGPKERKLSLAGGGNCNRPYGSRAAQAKSVPVNTRAGRGSLDGFQSGIPISAVVHGAPRSRGIPLRRSGESKRYAEAGGHGG
jgi:hypothetical protein